MGVTTTSVFGRLDRELCTLVEIIDDNVRNEIPEVFEVDFILFQQDELGDNVIANPISTITIVDNDIGKIMLLWQVGCSYNYTRFKILAGVI